MPDTVKLQEVYP